MLKSAKTTRRMLCLAAALSASVAAPALAQPVVDEVIVTGRYHVGDDVRSLSAPVSYRDLDLTTQAGRDALRERIRFAAQDLCRRLGENGLGAGAAAPSCEQDAIASARAQERLALDAARPPAYAVIVPPDAAYVAPTGPVPPEEAPAAPAYGAQASTTVTTQTVTNGPVPDTPQNRARLGGPTSNGGRRTAPAGD